MSTHWLSVRFRTESGYTPGKPAISSVRDCASFCSSPLVSQPGFINQLRCSTWIIITKTGIIRKASRAIISCNDDKSSREKMRNCGTHVLTRIRLSRKGVRGKTLFGHQRASSPESMISQALAMSPFPLAYSPKIRYNKPIFPERGVRNGAFPPGQQTV